MRYAHTNIAARDWRTLSEFYIRVFNCKLKPPERKLSGDWLDRATGLTDAALEGVHLLLPGHGEDGPTMEIFTYKDTYAVDTSTANRLGFTHIAFEVDDIERVYTDAIEYGATVLGKITERAIPGVGELKFVYLRDPEGNIVEIQSWDK